MLAFVLKDDGDLFGVIDDMVVGDNVALRIDGNPDPRASTCPLGLGAGNGFWKKRRRNWSNGVPPNCGDSPLPLLL